MHMYSHIYIAILLNRPCLHKRLNCFAVPLKNPSKIRHFISMDTLNTAICYKVSPY